jgi:hypothetical protein
MDATQIYGHTLDALSGIVIKMTTPEWDALLQSATTEQRQQAAKLLISAQHARMVLGNAVLQDIVQQLKNNENDLLTGINAVDGALQTLNDVTGTLNTISSLVGVAARIVTLV